MALPLGLAPGVKQRSPQETRDILSGKVNPADAFRQGGAGVGQQAGAAATSAAGGLGAGGSAPAAPQARTPTTGTMPTVGDYGYGSPPVGAQPRPQDRNYTQGVTGTDTAFNQTPAAFPSQNGNPLQTPGTNFTNPGYGEQALEYTQNRLLEDPFGGYMQNAANQALNPTQGENWMNQNLGTLDGPGQGDQYWNQVQGQFQDPFAGEQFARLATQQFGAQGASSAFNDQAQQQYGQFTNYSGPQNSQGQYGMSAGQLAGGTQGENQLGQIAGGYQQNGQYGGPNLAAGQYAQTQGAFGAMPIANFDPFYDRARQLGVQDYNRQAAGRGVYGSSEALSGVGNVITDIEAQRANRSFDAEMQRTQEQRMRQELLGNQARQGDLSSLGAFQANLSGAQTYGQLANMQGQLELDRHQTLGNLANNADSQALGAQNANISGLNAFANISNNADQNETARYSARTNAMNQADRTGLDRLQTGADIAFRGDENRRANFDSQASAANNAAGLSNDRLRLGADIASTGSRNDLARLDSFNSTAQGAEGQRQERMSAIANATAGYSKQVQQAISSALDGVISGDEKLTEQKWQMEILPMLQEAGMEQKDADRLLEYLKTAGSVAVGSG